MRRRAGRRRVPEGARRVGHRSRRIHARARGSGRRARRRAADGRPGGGPAPGAGRPRGRGLRRLARARARGGQLRGTPRRRGGAAGRRRLVRDLPAEGGVPGLRPTRGAAAGADPAAGARQPARRECSCSPRSTARSWPVPPPWTRRTRTTGRSGPRRPREILPKAVAMHPPLEGAEPIASYAGLRPAGRGVNYAIGASAASPALVNVAADALHRPDRLARSGRARGGDRGRARRGPRRGATAAAPGTSRSPGRGGAARPSSGRRHEPPAAPRDRRGHVGGQGDALRHRPRPRRGGPPREAARPSPLGLGGAGPAGRARGGGGCRGRAARRRRRRDRGLRARPPGRVGPRLGGRERGAAHADRDLAGQALAGGARPPRGRRRRCRGPRAQRHAARPVLLGRQAHLAARARRRRSSAPSTRGTLRLGTVDSWLCDMLGSGFATDPSTASRTQLSAPGAPDWDPQLLAAFGVPRDSLPAIRDSAGDLGVLRHPDWDRSSCRCGRRSWTSRPRSPARAAPSPAG